MRDAVPMGDMPVETARTVRGLRASRRHQSERVRRLFNRARFEQFVDGLEAFLLKPEVAPVLTDHRAVGVLGWYFVR